MEQKRRPLKLASKSIFPVFYWRFGIPVSLGTAALARAG